MQTPETVTVPLGPEEVVRLVSFVGQANAAIGDHPAVHNLAQRVADALPPLVDLQLDNADAMTLAVLLRTFQGSAATAGLAPVARRISDAIQTQIIDPKGA